MAGSRATAYDFPVTITSEKRPVVSGLPDLQGSPLTTLMDSDAALVDEVIRRVIPDTPDTPINSAI